MIKRYGRGHIAPTVWAPHERGAIFADDAAGGNSYGQHGGPPKSGSNSNLSFFKIILDPIFFVWDLPAARCPLPWLFVGACWCRIRRPPLAPPEPRGLSQGWVRGGVRTNQLSAGACGVPQQLADEGVVVLRAQSTCGMATSKPRGVDGNRGNVVTDRFVPSHPDCSSNRWRKRFAVGSSSGFSLGDERSGSKIQN
jgi:hypothetical protein